MRASEDRSSCRLSPVAPHLGEPRSDGWDAPSRRRQNLGHVDTRMVERHYGHLAPSYVAESVRKHAPSFGKTPSNVRAL